MLWPSVALASLWVPNLECGQDCLLKQSQPPAWTVPGAVLPGKHAFSQQPEGDGLNCLPIKVNCGKFRPR